MSIKSTDKFDSNLKCIFCNKKFIEYDEITFDILNTFECPGCDYTIEYNFDILSQRYIFYKAFKILTNKSFLLIYKNNITALYKSNFISNFKFYQKLDDGYVYYTRKELDEIVKDLVFL